MSRVVTTPVPAQADRTPQRPKRGWVLPAAFWALAALFGGILVWALPQAADARAFDARIAALSEKVARARSDAVSAETGLEDLRAELAGAEEAGAAVGLEAQAQAELVRELEKRLARRNAKIRRLEESARDAAAAAMHTSTEGGSSSKAPPPAPIPDPPFCYEGPYGEQICE